MPTIIASNAILIDENLQFVTIAIASTHPSPGRGAIFAGIYMNIPKAVKNMLKNKNKICIINESPNGNSETRYRDNVVKYPNKIQLIN